MNIFAVLPLLCDRSLYFICALSEKTVYSQWEYKHVGSVTGDVLNSIVLHVFPIYIQSAEF